MSLLELLLGTLVSVFCISLLIIRYGRPKIERVRHNEPIIPGDGPTYDASTEAEKRFRDSLEKRRRLRRDSVTAEPWRPEPSRPYADTRPQAKPIIVTRRQLEHVNIQRKLAGRPALNSQGFRAAAAIAVGRDEPRQPPDTTSDWLTYFILYQCFFADHQSHRVGVDGGVTIFPSEQYNGQGGEFNGAGAPGNWGAPDALALGAAALSASSGDAMVDAYQRSDAAFDPPPAPSPGSDNPVHSNTFSPQPSFDDPAPSYSAPAPEYTAPSPSPSYDSGSSFDSGSSSSSSDSGSSSSSSDGGGGGGGD